MFCCLIWIKICAFFSLVNSEINSILNTVIVRIAIFIEWFYSECSMLLNTMQIKEIQIRKTQSVQKLPFKGRKNKEASQSCDHAFIQFNKQ